MQKESAMTPNSCGRPAPPKSGATGGRCHRCTRPGTVWCPASEVERGGVVRSAHAHAAGREGPENGGSVEEPRDVRAARELVVARAPPGPARDRSTRDVSGRNRRCESENHEDQTPTRVDARPESRAHAPNAVVRGEKFDGRSPVFGMWMNTGPACIASGRASAPRSVTGTGPVGRKPANATPTAAAPAAYLAMRAYRDESHAPSPSDAAAPSGLRPAARAAERLALAHAHRVVPCGSTRAQRLQLPSSTVDYDPFALFTGWHRKMDAFSQPSVFLSIIFDFQSFHRRFLVYTDEPPPAPIERLVRSRPPPRLFHVRHAPGRGVAPPFLPTELDHRGDPRDRSRLHHRARRPALKNTRALSYRRRRARRSPPGPSSRRARSRRARAPRARSSSRKRHTPRIHRARAPRPPRWRWRGSRGPSFPYPIRTSSTATSSPFSPCTYMRGSTAYTLLFSSDVSDPPDVVAARKSGPREPFFTSTKMPSARASTGNTSMGRQVSMGVRRRRTGFSGYHDLISPVRRSNVDAVHGHTMQPSWVRRALVNPSEKAPSAGERDSMHTTESLYQKMRMDLPSASTLRAVSAREVLEVADLGEGRGRARARGGLGRGTRPRRGRGERRRRRRTRGRRGRRARRACGAPRSGAWRSRERRRTRGTLRHGTRRPGRIRARRARRWRT